MTANILEFEISTLREENNHLKAQIENIKSWLRSIPQDWIDIDNTTSSSQEMIKDVKEWLLRIPAELLSELEPKNSKDKLNKKTFISTQSGHHHINDILIAGEEIDPLIKIEEKENDAEIFSDKAEKKTDPILLLSLDMKEEFDETDNEPRDLSEFKPKTKKKKVKATSKAQQRTICNICQKSVVKISEHMETHNEQRNRFTCDVCNKDLVTALGFKRHMRQHTGEDINLCTMCGKSFTSSANLSKHIEIHLDEKKYVCNLCGKGFNTSSGLSSHMYTHSTEKHECKECGKLFKSIQHVQSHMRANHTEQSLVCSYCQKTFKYSRALREHTMTHTGEKPHKCTVCDKQFCKSTQLKRHMLIHEGIKPHKCPLCDKSFNQISNMRTHLKIHESK